MKRPYIYIILGIAIVSFILTVNIIRKVASDVTNNLEGKKVEIIFRAG